MRWKIAAAFFVLNLLHVCTVQSSRNANLCSLSPAQIGTLYSLATYPQTLDRSLINSASTVNVPNKVCQRKFDIVRNSIDDLIVNYHNCSDRESTECVDSKHDAVKKSVNDLIKSSDGTTRGELRKLMEKLQELHAIIYESLLAEQSYVKLAESVKAKIRSGNYQEAARFLIRSTEPKKIEQLNEIVELLELKNEDSKKVLLFAKALRVSPISLNVAQSILNTFDNFTDANFLFFHHVVQSVVELADFKNQPIVFQRDFRALLGSLIDQKKIITKRLLRNFENEDYATLSQIEKYFAPQKMDAILRDLTLELMKQELRDAVQQLIKLASNLKDLGNQCILLENANQFIQQSSGVSSVAAFQLWLYARKTVNEEPGFKEQGLVDRKKCVKVQDDLEQYAPAIIDNLVKIYDEQPSRSLLGYFYAYPATMKWFLPDLIEQKYRGQRGSLLKLINFYYKINQMEDSIIFLKSLVDQLVIFEETNSFEAFQIFAELKLIMSLAEYPNAGNIFKKKCITAKSHMPRWMTELIWKDAASCKITNRFNGNVLVCSTLSLDELNSIYTKPPKGTADEKWKIQLEPRDGRLVLQNRQFSNSFLHHGEGLKMPRGTVIGWSGWSNHEEEKWKIEGVPGDFVKIYYADGIYLTGSNRRCNIGFDCVDLKRSTQDHLQQWKVEC